MEFDYNRCTLLKRVAAVYVISISASFAMGHIDFATPMGDPTWRMSGNPIRCGLSLTIPNYGTGYFEQYAAHPPHFIMRKIDQADRPLPASIVVRQPMWKPGYPSMMVGKLSVKPGPFGIYLRRDNALQLLNYLSRGMETTFNYHSDLGFGVTVALTPLGFQKPYSRYQKCVGNLLSFDYDSVRESVFHYGPDGREMSEDDKAQLKRIAQYVAADPQIKVIRVVGYADESGRKGYNNAISQDRAQSVQNYLITLGVPQEQLSVTWLGAQKPVARNDTDEGRAANRRVVINLIKK